MKQIIVIVYLQAKLPKYAITNLKYLSKRFTKQEIFLLTDSVQNIEIASNLGINTFKVEGIKNLWPEVTDASSQPRNFREGFWITSLIRFKAIEKFMQYHESSQIIQIEADVILMPNFPFTKIDSFAGVICYPLVSEELGAASVFIVKDYKSLVSFNSKIEKLIKESPSHSDMTTLAVISRENPELISILPTIPNFVEAPLSSSSKIYTRMSSNFEFFEGVFDAATWGMYFLGTDARNSRGLKKIGANFEFHSLKSTGFRIFNDRFGNIHASEEKSQNFTIYNLHVHSKNSWIFNFRIQSYVILTYRFFHLLRIRILFSASIFLFVLINKISRILRVEK